MTDDIPTLLKIVILALIGITYLLYKAVTFLSEISMSISRLDERHEKHLAAQGLTPKQLHAMCEMTMDAEREALH